MNVEATPRALLNDSTAQLVDIVSEPVAPIAPLNVGGGDSNRPALRRQIPGDALGRITFAVLFLGTLLVAWKLHMFKVPWQIATDRAAALGRPVPKFSLLDRGLGWVTPWRWGRGDMLSNNLATGGDMGAHVWSSDYLRRALLPKGRLTGWSNDWFGGFPVLNFYFPLPTLVIGFLGFIIPANVAFKIPAPNVFDDAVLGDDDAAVAE